MTSSNSWDHAVLNGFGYNLADVGVYFTNGQPPWREVNGQGLSGANIPVMLDKLAADGWILTGNTYIQQDPAPAIDVPLVAVLPDPLHPFRFDPLPQPIPLNPESQTFHFSRPALPVPYEYQELTLSEVGELPAVEPTDEQAMQTLRRELAGKVDAALEPYERDGWERDPYPSAVEPLLTHHLFGKWRVKAVLVRLRRPISEAIKN